jgi:hypothetical protein
VLDPLGITVLHPDDFLLQQLELEPLVVLPAFKAMRARLKNPVGLSDDFFHTNSFEVCWPSRPKLGRD